MMYDSWYLGRMTSPSRSRSSRSVSKTNTNGDDSTQNNSVDVLSRRFTMGFGRRQSMSRRSSSLYPGLNYGDITIVLLFYLVQQHCENLRQVPLVSACFVPSRSTVHARAMEAGGGGVGLGVARAGLRHPLNSQPNSHPPAPLLPLL